MDSDLIDEDIQREPCSDINAYSLDMDIKENMAHLKAKISEGLNIDFSEASVWVLSQKRLSEFETLQELCGSYAGIVQIQFFITFNEDSGEQKIDILDVLKPSEEKTDSSDQAHCTNSLENNIEDQPNKKLKTSKWIASAEFKGIQRKYCIPKNPALWSPSHVEKWLTWAEVEFNLENLNPKNLKLNGRFLCNMKVNEYRQLVPNDPEDIFYMHFELLRKTHVVAVLHSSIALDGSPSLSENSKESGERIALPFTKNLKDSHKKAKEGMVKLSANQKASAVPSLSPALPVLSVTSVESLPDVAPSSCTKAPSSHAASSTSQPIQLWQFLLELLTDSDSTDIISWCGENGEFKFHQPDLVAKLWGEQKGKTNMNYDKLSRSLRYYYDADNKVINKVSGKKYVYKFELDLRNILGYDSSEIQEHMRHAKKAKSKQS